MRVTIVGNCGAGKTTLATELAKHLGGEGISIDELRWMPGWSSRSPQEVATKLREATKSDSWLLDIDYIRLLSHAFVLDRSDVVVWFDYPISLILRRTLRRSAHRLLHRVEVLPGCRETFRGQVWPWRSVHVAAIKNQLVFRPKVEQLLEALPESTLFLHLRKGSTAEEVVTTTLERMADEQLL